MGALDWLQQHVIQPGEQALGSSATAAKNALLGDARNVGNSLSNAGRSALSYLGNQVNPMGTGVVGQGIDNSAARIRQSPLLNSLQNYGQQQVLNPITEGIANYQVNPTVGTALGGVANVGRGAFNITPLGVAANAAISQGAGTAQALRGVQSTPGQNFANSLQLSQGLGVTNPYAAGAIDLAANAAAINPEGIAGGFKTLGNLGKDAGFASNLKTVGQAAGQTLGLTHNGNPTFFDKGLTPTGEQAAQAAKTFTKTLVNQKGYRQAADLFRAPLPEEPVLAGKSAVFQNGQPLTKPIDTAEINLGPAQAEQALIQGKVPNDVITRAGETDQGKVTIHIDPKTRQILSWDSDNPALVAKVKSAAQAPLLSEPNYDQYKGLQAQPAEEKQYNLQGAQFRSKPSIPNPFEQKPSFDARQYVNDMENAQQEARGESSVFGKVRQSLAGAKADLVDSLSPIEDRLGNAQKQGGYQVTPSNNITYQLDRALRSGTLAGQFANDNGLTAVIKSVPDTASLDQYLIARHAADLEKNGIATGRNTSQDAQLVQSLSPQYQEAAQAITAYTQKMLDYAVQSGLISDDTAAFLKNKYPNYVPVNRIFSEAEQELMNPGQTGGKGMASLSKQTLVQRIEGSGRQIESPLGSLLKNTDAMMSQGERNKSAQILASYKDLPGNPFNIREVRDGEVPANSTFTALREGKLMRYATDPEIAAAAKSLDQQQLGLVGKILSYPTRVLKLGATGINLPFTLSNVAKDQATAFINSDRAAQTSLLNPAVFLKSFFAAVGHDDLYQEVVRNAAGGTSFDIARETPKLTVGRIRAQRNIGTKIAYTITHPEELLRAAEDIVGRSEEITRIQQYKGTYDALIREGRTPQDAALIAANAAQNNTTNFSRGGNYGKVLNSVLPYLNAGIQGSRTLVRSIYQRPVQTGAKLAVVAFFPMAASTAWNLSDPARKQAYDDIPEYEKQGNIIIIPPNPVKDPNTNRWNAIKIPVSQEAASLMNIVRRGVETAHGEDPQKFSEIAANLFSAGTSLSSDPRQLAGQLIPQAIKPQVENLTNTNLYTGNQIVPQGMRNLPANQQVRKSTSETSRRIGSVLGVSPLVIENDIGTAAGGVGRQLVNASDQLLKSTGNNVSGVVGGQDIPTQIANRFVSAAGGAQDQAAQKRIQSMVTNQGDQAILDLAMTTMKNPDGTQVGGSVTNSAALAAQLSAHPSAIPIVQEIRKQSYVQPVGDYRAGATYQNGTAVNLNGQSYVAIKDTHGVAPGSETPGDPNNVWVPQDNIWKLSGDDLKKALQARAATGTTSKDPLDPNSSSTAANSSIYLHNFPLFEGTRAVQRLQGAGNYDPLYDLPDSYARQVLYLRTLSGVQATGDPVAASIKAQSWYRPFQAQESAYYKAHPIPASAGTQNAAGPYPEMPAELSQYADYIRSLPTSSARAQAYQTPQGQALDAYYAKLNQYNSAKQANLLGTAENVAPTRYAPGYIASPLGATSSTPVLNLGGTGSTGGSSTSQALQTSSLKRAARRTLSSVSRPKSKGAKVKAPRIKLSSSKSHVRQPHVKPVTFAKPRGTVRRPSGKLA